MVKAYGKKDFDKLMVKVVKVDHRKKDYLEDAGYEKWSRVHSIVNRGRMMTSNIAECINGCLGDARRRKRYIVCLERKICTCGRFQHDEIPCEHVIADLKHKNVTDMHSYCSDDYKPDTLEKTYEVAMVPMPDKED
ncbi:hypothetical protein H5410_019274 [Solanum commersonii]|uniref:SWIM-type domain-containing protein n=1 Tax=Solanum commersonii TaxID=4109 RepID=A0A9J6A513_SOLCO|nr:hypothetical protein H5410_019274 [Solanum commersonii]